MNSFLECFICKSNLANLNTQPPTLLSKPLCTSCHERCVFRFPRHSSPNLSLQPLSLILPLCPLHNKKQKLVCADCLCLVCSNCVLSHSPHKLQSAEFFISQINSSHQSLEFGILFSLLHAQTEALSALHQSFLDYYAAFSSTPLSQQISEYEKNCIFFYTQLQELNSDFKGIPLESIKTVCEIGRENFLALNFEQLLHYVEWNERVLHVIKVDPIQFSTYLLPDDAVVPYYCRTVCLPLGRLFLCGGRRSSREIGLSGSYFISFSPVVTVKQTASMSAGRSNHCALYCEDYVYAIAGLDTENHYTNHCERFSLRTEKWEPIASLNENKDTVAGATDSTCEHIYVMGGRNAEMCATIEKYSIQHNTWNILSLLLPIETCLHGVSLIPFDNTLLIYAGQNKASDSVNSFFTLNLSTSAFSPVTPLGLTGGCVVDHAVLKNSTLTCLLFEGFTFRSLVQYSLSKSLWEKVN
jgi:hypothetical protein